MSDEYIKQFKIWSGYAELLDEKEFDNFFYEREVWWCALGVNIGSEQDGARETFERPVLIIKKIRKDLALIAPLTTKVAEYPYRIKTWCTGIESQIILDQIKIISSKRLLRKMAFIKNNTYQEVLIECIKLILS